MKADGKQCCHAGDEAIIPLAVAFLKDQGRMKYLRPLYRSLNRKHKAVAVETFKEAASSYHPIAAKMVASDLGVSEST